MSVPSRNVTITTDRPNMLALRRPSSPGMPPIANSTGNVICRSISSATMPGATVLICTWTGVVSGKASITSRLTATQPTRQTTAAPNNTARRRDRDQAMMASSMRRP